MRPLLPRPRLAAAIAALWCVAGAAGAGPGVLSAQGPAQGTDERPPSITFDRNRTRLTLDFGDLLLDGGLRRALEQGLPLRVRLRAELWRDGFFDRQEGEAEWGASVILDPVAREYEVAVAGEGRIARRISLVEVTEVLEAAFSLELRPEREARYYYRAELEIETLSLSDLDELRRWLGGDVASAVRGEKEVENAIASGVRRIFVRALGLPARRERLSTPTFEWRRDGDAESGGERDEGAVPDRPSVIPLPLPLPDLALPDPGETDPAARR